MQTVSPDSWPSLDVLFNGLCAEAVSLRFDGYDRLVQVLGDLTPTGERHIAPAWWQVRLNVLRSMGLQDEFELAALDYCVTFEVAPPEWRPASCQIDLGALRSTTAGTDFDFGDSTAPMDVEAGRRPVEMALRGAIQGDATPALAQLDAAPVDGTRLLIDCTELVRVDFAAAGGLLNWVSTRQAEGKHVQFQNVNRLVAAFFNVIGINEYAKVIPRAV